MDTFVLIKTNGHTVEKHEFPNVNLATIALIQEFDGCCRNCGLPFNSRTVNFAVKDPVLMAGFDIVIRGSHISKNSDAAVLYTDDGGVYTWKIIKLQYNK